MTPTNNTIDQIGNELIKFERRDELQEDELNKVVGGRKAGGDEFLQFKFQTVFTT